MAIAQSMAKLPTQLENAAEVRNVLKRIDLTHQWGDELVDVHLIYLPCSNGQCDIMPLLELIKKCLMTNFVLSYRAIQKKLEINASRSEEALFKRAVRFLSQDTAHGELGELLLFTLLDVYLEAPKILSKISMKTSRRVPVFGADAVHAQYVDGELRLYLGESKLYTSFTGAARKATKSISTAIENYEHDFTLIETYLDFPDYDEVTAQKLISLLNPFTNENIRSEVLYSPCFIGFTEPECFSDESQYLDVYKKIAHEHIDYFYTKLVNQGVHHSKAILLMLPLSSTDEVVKQFIEYLGIEA